MLLRHHPLDYFHTNALQQIESRITVLSVAPVTVSHPPSRLGNRLPVTGAAYPEIGKHDIADADPFTGSSYPQEEFEIVMKAFTLK